MIVNIKIIFLLIFILGLLFGLLLDYLIQKYISRVGGSVKLNFFIAAFMAIFIGFFILELYIYFGLTEKFFLYLIFIFILTSCAVIDGYLKILPNIIVVPGLIVAILFYTGKSILLSDIEPIIFSVSGAIVGGVIIYLIILISCGGMGMGDMKFLMMICAYIGVINGLISFLLAAFIGAIFAIILMILKLANRKTSVPFGPFLAASALIMVFFDIQIRKLLLEFFLWG